MNFMAKEKKSFLKILHSQDKVFQKAWDRGVDTISGATIFYTTAFREYEKNVFGTQFVCDASFVVCSSSNEVLAIVPLYVCKDSEGFLNFSHGGGFLRAPLIGRKSGISEFKKICKTIFDYIEDLAKKKNVCSHLAMVECVEILERRHYYNFLLDYQYMDDSSGTSVVRCDQEKEELRMNLRKSYKPLINKSSRLYNVVYVNQSQYDGDLCEEYRKLHFKAAGRQTRSIKSFEMMYQMIKDGLAYLILIQDANGKMVGAYYFLYHKQYVYYGSAATDPDLDIQSGVGHLGLWSGIMYAKKVGCCFLDVGLIIKDENYSEKQKMIDFYKQGFGGVKTVVFRGIKIFRKKG